VKFSAYRAVTLFVVILHSTLLWAGCAQEEAQEKVVIRPVWAIRVANPSDVAERTFPGRARAGKEVNLSYRVSGPLIAFPVDVGDGVKKGDVVSRMDPRDFETSLNTAIGQLDQAKAVLTRAQADLIRVTNIYKQDPGAISQVAIDRNRQQRDSAQAKVKSLQARVATAKNQLTYTRLRAPFDGVVVETYVENFETVVAKQPILRVLDPSRIEFVISVPESLISLTKYVEEITVTFDALPGIDIPARIKEVSKEASQATRTYPVTLLMGQPADAEILPGMAGAARIVSRLPEQSKHVGIEIPATAVFSGEDLEQSYVWIVDETSETLSRREVKIVGLSRAGTRVKAGLNPGEWIVIKGVHSVSEGEVVQILDASEEKPRS
jgi:RND family efflux transporter MFP subunit